ncbi:unnamed protein product [Soboliphyme baturini]|uniref:GOLGA2L5 domain-containing protein n=1 Tax=Soboliphyme baturini TaxID=241478 RepID=A0A183IQB4_9BILA|nr:unnamed protein product [Soboliphyme baturini]
MFVEAMVNSLKEERSKVDEQAVIQVDVHEPCQQLLIPSADAVGPSSESLQSATQSTSVTQNNELNILFGNHMKIMRNAVHKAKQDLRMTANEKQIQDQAKQLVEMSSKKMKKQLKHLLLNLKELQEQCDVKQARLHELRDKIDRASTSSKTMQRRLQLAEESLNKETTKHDQLLLAISSENKDLQRSRTMLETSCMRNKDGEESVSRLDTQFKVLLNRIQEGQTTVETLKKQIARHQAESEQLAISNARSFNEYETIQKVTTPFINELRVQILAKDRRSKEQSCKAVRPHEGTKADDGPNLEVAFQDQIQAELMQLRQENDRTEKGLLLLEENRENDVLCFEALEKKESELRAFRDELDRQVSMKHMKIAKIQESTAAMTKVVKRKEEKLLRLRKSLQNASPSTNMTEASLQQQVIAFENSISLYEKCIQGYLRQWAQKQETLAKLQEQIERNDNATEYKKCGIVRDYGNVSNIYDC